MLEHPCIIRGGITGIDPDSLVPEDKLTKAWILEHPAKLELSQEEKKLRSERLLSGKQGLTQVQNSALADEINEKHASGKGDLTLTILNHTQDPNRGILSSNISQR